MSPRLAAFTSVAVVALTAASASATPNFPKAVQAKLSLGAEPACTLCHAGPTQRGTVTTPFGASMRARGLAAYDEASLGRAIDALRGEKRDSDGDGKPDVDELTAGEDPNAGAGRAGDDAALVPEYGCSAAPARPTPGLSPLAALAALALVAWWAIRARRQPARQHLRRARRRSDPTATATTTAATRNAAGRT